MTQLKFTLLGTGSSGGVPRIGNDWGACDPGEPKNRRSRCAAMAELADLSNPESEPTRILIDTAPDMREQLLAANVGRVDGVLYTHDHADQTGGIDDLRVLAISQRERIKVYMDEATAETLMMRAAYCFQGSGDYPPILDKRESITPFEPLEINGPGGLLSVLPVAQEHGRIGSLGFRIGSLAYCNDLNALPQESLEALKGVEVLIIDALRYSPHPSHLNVSEAIILAGEIGARRTILTNMHIDLDFRTLCAELPDGIEPGYDGLSVELML